MVSRARASVEALSSLGEPSGLESFGSVEPVVSVVIPTLNEADGIAHCLSELPLAHLRESGFASEVVVVDGNSSDETVARAERFGARVVVENRLGYGLAYKTGFVVSRGEFLVALDGDHSYPASVVPWLINVMVKRNLDFVTTNRLAGLEPDAMDAIHRLGNWILSTAVRLLFSVRICDSQSGMWVIRKSALEKILPRSDGMAFSQEIKIRAFRSCKCLEVPIQYRKRIGSPKIQLVFDGFKNLLHLFRLRFSTDFN
jgi:glycosyltransferase involved in cell wall biosynthesis